MMILRLSQVGDERRKTLRVYTSGRKFYRRDSDFNENEDFSKELSEDRMSANPRFSTRYLAKKSPSRRDKPQTTRNTIRGIYTNIPDGDNAAGRADGIYRHARASTSRTASSASS